MNRYLPNQMFAGSLLLTALLFLAGCTSAPKYVKPAAPASASFKEAPHDSTAAGVMVLENGNWKPAEPSEALARGQWWTIFNDPALNELEVQAQVANQNLQIAVARLKQARGLNQATRASLFPTLDLAIGPSRQKASGASQGRPAGDGVAGQTAWHAQAGIAYELDLFGRVAAATDAASLDVQRSEALLRSVQLAVQADVAQNYFALRELDAEVEVFTQTVDLRKQALVLIQRRFDEGAIAELDLARAESELATAQSEAMTVQRMRAASEHSLAVLLGQAPSEFSVAPRPLQQIALRIPAGLPSALLERRPDIAAAERAMAAANARVGVAKSAFFPSLSLTGSGGFESASLGDLFKWSSRSFLVGAALSMPLFDGGRRKGELAQSRAVYQEEVARYRQQVLSAFREVEDNLSELRVLEEQTVTQAKAGQASGRAAKLARIQYAEGAVNFLDVIDAERTALQTRRAAVRLHGSQAAATVNLIRALGGGWTTPQPTLVASTTQQ